MASEVVATDFMSDYLACQTRDEKISAFLRMLDIESLRRVYRLNGRGVSAPEYPSGEYYFYFDPLAFVGPSAAEEQSAEAFGYNNAPEIMKRRAQLNADGIFPSIVSYPEPGNAHLTIMVGFNEKGRRRLGGDGSWFSRLASVMRRFSWICWGAAAIVVLPFVLADRVLANSWMQTFIGLGVLLGFRILGQRYRKQTMRI